MTTQPTIVIGSRGSALALWQARHIAAALEALGAATRLESCSGWARANRRLLMFLPDSLNLSSRAKSRDLALT